MPDIDQRVRRDLAILAHRMPATDITGAAIRHGQQRRLRRTSALATTAVAVVVAAVVVPLTLVGRSTTVTTFPRPVSPVPTSRHVVLSRPDASVTPDSFQVVPPPFAIVRDLGLPAKALPQCRPSAIHGTVRLRSSPDGVIGVIDLAGRNCSLDVTNPTEVLRSATGATLDVRQGADNTRAPDNDQWRASPTREAFGLAWLGSWCGPVAAQLQVRTAGGAVDLPLRGPMPSCHGRSGSTLSSGPAGLLGSPVQMAPPEWSPLIPRLTVNHVINEAFITGLVITFSNPTASPIPLSPVPTYVVGVHDEHGDGTEDEVSLPLPYPASELVVPAHGSLRVALPKVDYAQDSIHFRPRYHAPVIVTVQMSGVTGMTAHTRQP